MLRVPKPFCDYSLVSDNAVFGGQFWAYLRLFFVTVSHQLAIVFQLYFVPECICVRKEGGEGVVSRSKPCSMTYGCGTVLLYNDVLADAQQLSSSHLSTGSALASQRMLAAV